MGLCRYHLKRDEENDKYKSNHFKYFWSDQLAWLWKFGNDLSDLKILLKEKHLHEIKDVAKLGNDNYIDLAAMPNNQKQAYAPASSPELNALYEDIYRGSATLDMNSDDLCIINFNMEFKTGYIMIWRD